MKTMSSRLKATLAPAILLSVSLVARVEAAEILTTPDPFHNAAAGGNGQSTTPIITPDGRFVLFMSAADNLVADTGNAPLAVLFPPRLNVLLRDCSNAVTTLVSVNLSGTGGGNGDSIPAGISTNGRYALFESSASDLIAGDTNGASDVFVRDLVAGTTVLVSADTNGLPGNGASDSGVLTPDGRFVAFVSAANDLVAGDTNGIRDVFVRDLLTGVTTLVSVGAKSPNIYGSISSEAPEITPDGRYVAFYSTATNLVPGGNNSGDIYVRDLVAGTTIWASTAARPTLKSVQNTSNAVSFSQVLSADGGSVAFETSQTVGTTNPTRGIILRYNLGSGFTDVVNTNAAVPFGATEDFRTLALTPDGRFVAFVANANDTSGNTSCIEVWDASSGMSTLAGGGLGGAVQSNSLCAWPAITSDGRFVAFLSNATNLVTNALSGQFHVYVRDLQDATTTLVDADTDGIGSGVTALTLPCLSDDGGFVVFEAWDGNLVADDSNNSYDVFMRDLAGATTELISCHDPALPPATPGGPSTLSQLSVCADGRYVAFASEADDLVPNDTNGCRDIFVRDLVAGTNILASVDLSGVASGNGVSSEPAISSDGRYVAFSSFANDLVAGDTNQMSDVFVRDLQTGTTVLASVNTNGTGGGNQNSYSPIITADGHAVLFHSKASNLAAGSFGNAVDNLFWRDLSLNVTYAVTVYSSGYTGIGVVPTAMTPDGRYVVAGSPNTAWYLWDSQLAARIYTNTVASGTLLASVSISPDGNRIAYSSSTNLYVVDRAVGTNFFLGVITSFTHAAPCFSGDGRFLAHVTTSANVPGDTNGLSDIYLYDFQTGSNTLVSQPFNAFSSANGNSDSPDISPDGRFVAYRSAASNLVPGDTNGVPDVFLWDRLTGATMLLSVSLSANSTANNRSLTPVFSGDSMTVFFESWASDLFPQDFNRASDLFAVSLLSAGAVPVFLAQIYPGGGPGQGVWISWPVVAGKYYQVQFKNNLTDPLWQNLDVPVSMVGNLGYLNDLAPGSGQRFYRIVAN